jgi:hypothetical protein
VFIFVLITFVEHSVSALFKKKSLVSIFRKFLKPWGSSSDNYFTKAWWAPCFLHFWIQARNVDDDVFIFVLIGQNAMTWHEE